MRRWAGLAAQFLTLSAWGAGEAPHAPYHPPEVLTWTSGIQVVVSLLLVLGVMAAAVWMFRKFQWPGQSSAQGKRGLRVMGSVAVGQRERVVLVEWEDTWVMVGVAPGQVRALHVQKKPNDDVTTH